MEENHYMPPTPEEINDMFDSYQRDLAIRGLHLKLLPVFSTAEMDDLIALLKETYQIDLSERPPQQNHT